MNLTAVGFASALAFGSKLGSQAAAATVDFAQLLTEKISEANGSTASDEEDVSEGRVSKAFEESLQRFDGFLESIGLDPGSVRIIAKDSEDQPKVEVRSSEFASWQKTSLHNWIETHAIESRNLNLPQQTDSLR